MSDGPYSANDNPRDVDLAVALFERHYGPRPFNTPMTQEVTDMPDTLTIRFENDGGRVRASIDAIDGGDLGVFAVAGDRQTAAAQVVKMHDMVSPVKPQATVLTSVNLPPRPVHYGRRMIESLTREAAETGSKLRIEYEDQEGHVTTRVIAPSFVRPNGTMVAFDELRDAVRSFRLAGIQSVQEV
jgi:hypothetical protein